MGIAEERRPAPPRRGQIDVLLTADRRMQYQQKLTSFGIGVVVLVTPRLQLETLERAIDAVRMAITNVSPGEIVHVMVR